MKKISILIAIVLTAFISGCASSPKAVYRVTETGLGISPKEAENFLGGKENIPQVKNVYTDLLQNPHPLAAQKFSSVSQIETPAEKPRDAKPEIRKEIVNHNYESFLTKGRAEELAKSRLPRALKNGEVLISYPIKSENFDMTIGAVLHENAQPVLIVGYENKNAIGMINFRDELGMVGISNTFSIISGVPSENQNDGIGELVCIR